MQGNKGHKHTLGALMLHVTYQAVLRIIHYTYVDREE